MKINPLKAEKLMEMNVFMQKLQIRQKTCYIEQNGSGGPIFYGECILIVEMK